mgnify:CR=1 FL=1
MINRMIESTEGEITIDGKNIKELNPVELRRSIGYVIQQIGLMPHMTVKENIVLVPKLLKWSQEKKDEKAKELIRLVDLPEEYLDRYPSELSGGQQQRISIARALCQEPTIILADEPVASLDPLTTKQVMDDLKKINEELGITILINLHFVDLAKEYGSRIIGLRAGELVYDGPASEANDEVFNHIYGRSIKDDEKLGVE